MLRTPFIQTKFQDNKLFIELNNLAGILNSSIHSQYYCLFVV